MILKVLEGMRVWEGGQQEGRCDIEGVGGHEGVGRRSAKESSKRKEGRCELERSILYCYNPSPTV